MAGNYPVVCVFGAEGLELFSSPECPPFEARELDTRCHATDDGLGRILARDRPAVIVSIGRLQDYPKLNTAAADVRRRWIHFESASDLARMGRGAFYCFIDNCVRERNDLPPLVSVFTPAYNTGEHIERAYASLRAQAYTNWEWIIVDDSEDNGATFRVLERLARADHRVGVFKHHAHSGTLGQVKRWACQLANGEFLVELDHDDELTPNALQDVVSTFKHFDGSASERPLAGFVYSDYAEVDADGGSVTYGTGWAFGYGSYRSESHRGRTLAVANTPNINAKTIRHIVGVPNHVRCWQRDCYREVGGHARHVHVADDYELLLRTFLGTRMARVPKLGYLQWRNRGGAIEGGNTHKARNKEIQRLTRAFSEHYDGQIHARLLALGVDDFIWKEGASSYSRLSSVPNQEVESHCTLLLP
jgi:O-antigen biosynthesis protein